MHMSEEVKEQLLAWIGQGVDVELHESRADHPRYTAQVEEFGLTGEGDTLESAVISLLSLLNTRIESFLQEGRPLPPRTPHPDFRDERAGNGSER